MRLKSLFAISLFVAGWAACSRDKDAEDASLAPLAIEAFDVSEKGWGDAPLPVHFVWSIQSTKTATCKLDLDGDGTFDKTIEECTSLSLEGGGDLPTFTFSTPGEYHPRLVVTDGDRTVEATTTVFANRLEFSKQTVFPEQLPGFLSAEVTGTTKVKLDFVDATRAPDLKEGDFVWGTSGSGYLLKVTSATKTDGIVNVVGVQGKINEAIENGFFGARDVEAPMDDVKCLSPECASLTFEKIESSSGGAPSSKSIGRKRSPLTLKGAGNFGLKVPLPAEEGIKHSLFVGLAVKEFVLEVKWFKLKRATLDMRPGFQYEFSIEKELASKEWRLGTISLGTIPIGPVIVTPVVLPTVRVGASLKVGGSVGLNLPFQVKYDGGWTAGIQPDLKNTAAELLDPNGASAGGSAEATFIPKVNALILGIAGPYVGPTATLSIEGKVQTAPASDLAKCGFPYQLCFTAKVGAGGEYGAELPWIDGASVKKEFSIAEASLWEKCLGKPDENGECPKDPPNVDAGLPKTDAGPDADGGPDANGGDAGCPTDGGRSSNPACAKCEHDVCKDGTALSPKCSPCAQKVCDADIYCCTESWTLSCRVKANMLCGAGCPE